MTISWTQGCRHRSLERQVVCIPTCIKLTQKEAWHKFFVFWTLDCFYLFYYEL